MGDRLWVKKNDIERIAREQREEADRSMRALAMILIYSFIFWVIMGMLIWRAL